MIYNCQSAEILPCTLKPTYYDKLLFQMHAHIITSRRGLGQFLQSSGQRFMWLNLSQVVESCQIMAIALKPSSQPWVTQPGPLKGHSLSFCFYSNLKTMFNLHMLSILLAFILSQNLIFFFLQMMCFFFFI